MQKLKMLRAGYVDGAQRKQGEIVEVGDHEAPWLIETKTAAPADSAAKKKRSARKRTTKPKTAVPPAEVPSPVIEPPADV